MRQLTSCLVVVGGHSRGVGKTAVVEHVLRSRPHEAWAAVKISAHRHAPAGSAVPITEEARESSTATQTGRYLAAGASRAWLCRAPSGGLDAAAAFVVSLLDAGWNVVVESNRIVQCLSPDVSLFVVSARTDDWKASSAESLRGADAIVLSPGSSRVPPRAHALGGPRVARLPAFRFTDSWGLAGLDRWISGLTQAPPPAHCARPHRRALAEIPKADIFDESGGAPLIS